MFLKKNGQTSSCPTITCATFANFAGLALICLFQNRTTYFGKKTKVIDRLHLRNHKNELCHKLYSAEPLKAKCPDLNTMVAEQTFAWSARYKKILNAMPMRRFLFYYHRMVVRRNKYTSECHKLKKTPLLPKVRTVT